VFQVLDVIAPPYTTEFVQLFHPMISSNDITGSLRAAGDSDQVSEFLRKFIGYLIIQTAVCECFGSLFCAWDIFLFERAQHRKFR
jgi:hypothetical protein